LPAWTIPAELQEGIVSRGQLLAAGLTPAQARTNIDNGRWRPLLPGVYATFTGPVSPLARTWSAVLYAGQGAIASHRTALWLASVLDEPTDPVHVSIPASRRVLPQPNVRIHLSRALDDPHQRIVHPSSLPPRSRLEVALLDQCERETANQVTHLVLTPSSEGSRLRTGSTPRWRPDPGFDGGVCWPRCSAKRGKVSPRRWN
jgi:hypothetical protein